MRASDKSCEGVVEVGGETFYKVSIPSSESFLRQWHLWIHKIVSAHFKRDRDRMMDTVQNVRLRLLQKDFIGRWFFKHLKNELVTRLEAERMLGGARLKYISQVVPAFGSRADESSLWRVSDLLEYAKFDHSRYYYSIQGHTIDSATVLRLLGQGEEDFGVLESLYRQGRLKPAELTEHRCQSAIEPTPAPLYDGNGQRICSIDGCGRKHYSRGYCSRHYGKHVKKSCPLCEKGRESLKAKGISLAHRWTDPSVRDAVRRVRWNDAQLKPFLRDWKGRNAIKTTPREIYRPVVEPSVIGKRSVCSLEDCHRIHYRDGYCDQHHGVSAGLLKYARMVTDHEVVNDFKRMSRTHDVSFMIFNNGMSPERSDSETVAWESDENDETPRRVLRDADASASFDTAEAVKDLAVLFERAGLTQEEQDVIVRYGLDEQSVKECAVVLSMSSSEVQHLRSSAMKKLRGASVEDEAIETAARESCEKHGCPVHEMLGSSRFGKCVLARADFVMELTKLGMSAEEIVARTPLSEKRVSLSIERGIAL